MRLRQAGTEFVCLGLAASIVLMGTCVANGVSPARLDVHGGRAIYDAACAACHGTHGEGTPKVSAGFDPPKTFPHWNKCDESTPEFARDYKAAIRDGGPARGFSPIMPSFKEVLTSQQMDQVVAYLRSLCEEPGWPVGELNVPRALLTEKAFPESETILTTTVNAKGPPGIDNELVYERVLGKHDQLEVSLPFSWVHKSIGGYSGGVGDIAIGDKHVLYTHLRVPADGSAYHARGSILSLQGEIVLATGDQKRGLGAGEPSVKAFLMYDRLFPRQTFVQLQGGIDVPRHTDYGPRSAFLRSAVGKSFSGDDHLGRLWSPMFEFIGNRDLTPGTTTDWDLIAECQVTVNRRQHIRTSIGYRVPLNDTLGRPKQFIAYFLWDWFDGGLFEGWK